MYKKNTVIITADHQEEYISEAISSCIHQKKVLGLQIFVIFTKLRNELYLKNRFKKNRNIFFIKTKRIKKFSTQDQLYKISIALKKIKNGNVYLLDGDDIFYKNKIYYLQEKIKKNNLILNNYNVLQGKNIFNTRPYKKYKENILYKKFINNWPDKISTSCISISSQLLKKFYKDKDPYLWKYLAIDIQIVIFYNYHSKIEYLDTKLTLKRMHSSNLDSTFSNIFSKIYWIRRMEQHNYYQKINSKKNYFTLDFLLTKFINLVFRIKVNIFKTFSK